MEGLTDEEYRRLQKLQEICPEDDIFHLYVDAAPYLKFEETFNFFLNDLIEKKFKHKTENKGKKMEEPLVQSASKTLAKNVKSIKRKMPNDSPTSVKKLSDRLIQNNMERELELILYGNVSDLIRSNSEKIPRKSVESDSEESYHSLEEGSENENFSRDEPTCSRYLNNRSGKATIIRHKKSRQEENTASKFGTVDLMSDEDYFMTQEATQRNVPDSDPAPNENKKAAKDFSSFNELIMKNKDRVGLNFKNNFDKENELSSASDADPAKKEKISRIIENFFVQSQDGMDEPTPGCSKSNYENGNNVFKYKNFSDSNSKILEGSSERKKKEDSKSKFAGNDSAIEYSEDENDSRLRNSNFDKNLAEDLEIPTFPFVYAVSESYSPRFRLPKGNYLITNTVESIDDLGVKILHHPSNVQKTDAAKKTEDLILEEETLGEVEPFNPDESQPTCSAFSRSSKFADNDQSCTVPIHELVSFSKTVQNEQKDEQKNRDRAIKAIISRKDSGFDYRLSLPGPSTERTNRNVRPVSAGKGKFFSVNRDKFAVRDDEDDSLTAVFDVLKKTDPGYVKKETIDYESQKKVVDQETEPMKLSDVETEMIRTSWETLVKELPHLDQKYLLSQWKSVVGGSIHDFIQDEKLKNELENVKNELMFHLPSHDRKYLEEKANDFVFYPEGLRSFIEEEKRTMIIDAQYKKMVKELPMVDPAVLREKCEKMEGDPTTVENYIKTVKERSEEVRNIRIVNMHLILPDADPAFLEAKSWEFIEDDESFNDMLSELLENRNYPKADRATGEKEELWMRFVAIFDAKDFLKKIPDPEERFRRPNREDKPIMKHAMKFLRFRYPDADSQLLQKAFENHNQNLTNACFELDGSFRPLERMDASFKYMTIPDSFLLEMVYIVRQQEIREYLRHKNELRKIKFEEALSQNALLTCTCCYDDELLDTEVTACPEGHIICVKCVTRYVELKLGEGVTKFTCTTDECGTEFILSILEKVLPQNLYDKVLRKKQSAEVSEAGVSGLESCPSCDYTSVPNQDDKIFRCQNPDCLRETCRKCKEVSHIPLRCEEVEKPKDTQIRKEIEEKMTEALLRTCYKCGKKFVRNGGCNHMTCTCGAQMCYICQRPLGVPGYGFHSCPTYDEQDLHVTQVVRVGEAARDQALRENPDAQLVHDPTKIIPPPTRGHY